MIDKFDSLLSDSLAEFGIILHEQEPAAPIEPVQAAPEAAPEVATDDVPEGDIDSSSLNVNLVELARKALFVDPSMIDQGSKGLLSQHVNMDNVEKINDMINDITSIESSVDASPTITYDKKI